MHFPLGHASLFTIILPVPLTTHFPRQPRQTIKMEGFGAAAGLLQVLEYLMRLSSEVRSVYKEIKYIKQTTDDFDNDTRLMGITLAAINSELQTARSSNSGLPDWLNMKELQIAFDNANRTLLSLKEILVDIKEQNKLRQAGPVAQIQMYRDWKTYAPKINHHQSRIAVFVKMMKIPMMFLNMHNTTNVAHSMVQDHQAQLTLLRTDIAGLKNSIDNLRSHALMVCDDTKKMSEAALRGQSVEVAVHDAEEQVEVASKILQSATTAEATIASGTTVGSRTIYQRHRNSDESEATQAPRPTVYNAAIEIEASISLIGLPLSDRERNKITSWRDSVIKDPSSRPDSKEIPSLIAEIAQHRSQTTSTFKSSSAKLALSEPETLHLLDETSETKFGLEMGMGLTPSDLKEISSAAVEKIRSKGKDSVVLKKMRKLRCQVLQVRQVDDHDIPTISKAEHAYEFLDAIFQTNTSPPTDDSRKLKRFDLSPSLMEARYILAKIFYHKGNLVSAAPLLIIFAKSEMIRILSLGDQKMSRNPPQHTCRPETERMLLCGKLLCQLDPFSFRGPRSFVCLECRGKCAWPYLPMVFAYLALHKFSHGAMKLPKDFTTYARVAVSGFFSVVDTMVEDMFGTLAVACAVQKMMKDRDKSFHVESVPMGIDMDWKGSITYFVSQQSLMASLARTNPEESANLGIELLSKSYRRINADQEIRDGTTEPELYQCIRRMLVKNGGKLWMQTTCQTTCTHSPFPVLEYMATCTPVLQCGVFGAAEEIEYLLDSNISENPSFNWTPKELTHLIRIAINAGNPMAVAVLIRSQIQSHKPMDWAYICLHVLLDHKDILQGGREKELNPARWKAVETAIRCIPRLPIVGRVKFRMILDKYSLVLIVIYVVELYITLWCITILARKPNAVRLWQSRVQLRRARIRQRLLSRTCQSLVVHSKVRQGAILKRRKTRVMIKAAC
ncbi:hypothetical protein EDB80DRAFT_716481 [Ilyonectria destructans]|nr:hypothetical protein EDB80DRAFT_716481 [Ilyonectria destructans]